MMLSELRARIDHALKACGDIPVLGAIRNTGFSFDDPCDISVFVAEGSEEDPPIEGAAFVVQVDG